MKLNTNIYICTECKKIHFNLDELYFVEDSSQKGFCSAQCIEDFYTPLMHYFRTEIDKIIQKNQLEESSESELIFIDEHELFELTNRYDEIWCFTNSLKEEFYTYVKYYKNETVAMICTRLNQAPAYVFVGVKTNSMNLLKKIISGIRVDEFQNESNEIIENEDLILLNLIESKKSQLLAFDIMNRKNSDISFERFNLYDFSITETLHFPDEVYESKDKEGDLIRCYLKTFFDSNLGSFFYVVFGLESNSHPDETQYIPFYSFPTIDLEYFSSFRIGRKIIGESIN